MFVENGAHLKKQVKCHFFFVKIQFWLSANVVLFTYHQFEEVDPPMLDLTNHGCGAVFDGNGGHDHDHDQEDG